MARAKETQRDYSKLIDTKPPKDLLAYMITRGAFDRHYLIYRADWWRNPLTEQKEKVVRVTCTHCGESWLAEYIPADCCGRGYAPAPFGFFMPTNIKGEGKETISGRCENCPCCGHEASVTHIGNIPQGIKDNAWCMTVGRLEDKLVLYGWKVQRTIDKEGVSKFDEFPYEAYVLEKKKMIRLTAHRRCLSTDAQYREWEQRKKVSDEWGPAGEWMPWSKELLEGSTAENSALDLYMGSEHGDACWPVTYLRVWQKHPQVENLLRRGAGRIICEAIEAESHCGTDYYGREIITLPKLEEINWEDPRPAQMLGLNKNEFKFCVAQDWSLKNWRTYRHALERGHRLQLPQDMEMLMFYNDPALNELIEKTSGVHQISKCLRYLTRQNSQTKGEKMSPGFLRDYLDLAQLNHQDIRDPHVAFPKDLRKAHDDLAYLKNRRAALRYVDEHKKEIVSRRIAFQQRVMALEKYAWEHDGLIITPAQNEEALVDESTQLCHCVRTYAARMAAGECSIFFIRHKESPERSYFTLNLNAKTLEVIENRGKYNCARTPDVRKFEEEWLEHIREIAKKKKKKGEKIA